MAVKETSDENLIFELIEHERVVLKYYTDSCGKLCEELKTIFRKLSDSADYNDITFLLINADNNPIAKKQIEKKKQPIMNIYHAGVLVECRTVDTEDRIKELLDKLSAHKVEA